MLLNGKSLPNYMGYKSVNSSVINKITAPPPTANSLSSMKQVYYTFFVKLCLGNAMPKSSIKYNCNNTHSSDINNNRTSTTYLDIEND
ncbi:hypothetical protein KSF78_0007315 [Schistosoma japonicum]|nr:hypothetical protein KSF78_0007315 [Schistosoma japonicum]